MALGIWLYVLPPTTAVPLVMICSIVAQTSTLPSFWRSFDLPLVWPFVIGGLAGVPLGTLLIAHADPHSFKLFFGVLAAGVSGRALSLPQSDRLHASAAALADAAVGFAGGILGGLAGLSGPLPTLWASVRGWGKDERRGIFQTYNWTVLATSLCLQAGDRYRHRRGASARCVRAAGDAVRRLARRAHLSRPQRPQFPATRARAVVSVRCRPGLEQPRAIVTSFRDGPKDQTRNLEILRCAIAHRSSHLRCAPE